MALVDASQPNMALLNPLMTGCYNNNDVLSQGIFLGNDPLKFSLPLLLLEISLIFITCTAVQYLLRPFRQCRTVIQILTGILLGRSVLGRSFWFNSTFFPMRGTLLLDIVSMLSFILFLFSIGVKTDLGLLRKPGKRAVVIGCAGSFLSVALSMITYYTFNSFFPSDMNHEDLIFRLVLRLSLSSFAVIADTLDELGLLNSDLGRVTMSATLVIDIINWVVSTVVEAKNLTGHPGEPDSIFWLLIPLLFVLFIIIGIARPAMLVAIKRTQPDELLNEGTFVGVTLTALFTSIITEICGYHFILGPFLLGLALPGGMPLGVTCRERLDSMTGLLLPLYLVLAGYRTDFTKIKNFAACRSLALIFVICYVGKLIGSTTAALCFRMSFRDAVTIGLMANIRGIVEVSFFNGWGDAELATAEHFAILMVMLVTNTAITTPLVKLLYNPSARYIAHKPRTIQHAKPNTQLRVLACIHNEENVPSLLDLLEASRPSHESPIFVTALHLTELVGQATSIIRPYKKSKHRPNLTATDRIANAFHYFEQQSEGVVSVSPYVAIAPSATMHNDVCALAYNKKVHLIILPFHKQSDGTRETAKHTIRSINSSVVGHAPCSVAILVDRGFSAATCTFTNHIIERIVVYFIGGADDREALAYALRMARDGSISLTVVRFIYKGEAWLVDELGAQLDEEMMMDLRDQHAKNSLIMYMEKMVVDGEAIVEVINTMIEKFDLVIVGRRNGVECELTRGMSEWSDCPELGILGDMLASTDFGKKKVSILVVQQQQILRGGASIPDQK